MRFEGEISIFNLNGTWLALYPWNELAKDANVNAKSLGFRGVTLSHNVDSELEVEQTLAQAKKAGAEIIKSAQKVERGEFSGYFADLDGHLWEVAYNPFMWIGPND